MNDDDARMLVERAKELKCVYAVDEVLQNKKLSLAAAMGKLVEIIPTGFTCPEACRVRITLWNDAYAAEDFDRAEILYRTPLLLGDERVGELAMGYVRELLPEDGRARLEDDEVKLLDTIARRISLLALGTQRELSLLLDMLQRIDPDMLQRIGEKLRVHLKNTSGSANVDALFGDGASRSRQTYGEVNSPMSKPAVANPAAIGRKLNAGAATLLPQGDLYELISGWIQEQRVFALVKTVDSKDASIGDILDAVRKYNSVVGQPRERSLTETWLIAELAHRFLTNDAHVINLVLDNLHISDFESTLERIIGSGTSMGNIGGKGAGLFIAQQILNHAAREDPLLADIRTPRTWYLATDQIVDFLHYNNLEEMNAYKYNTTFHLRMTYDYVVTKIKNAKLPPHTVQMLSLALEDLGNTPIIVRSSSLLEDRNSGAFSGKYKSLFLCNKGTKRERLDALVDAILEVYSSMYNPDSIQYRRERGLLNFTEQMGVLIQEVVGRQVGRYYLPAFAGVAFSHNVLRWSTRITREGGLVRMVMGLGTRAVDRVSDDYPILFSPGQPDLRINQTPADIKHYSPKHVDLINLESGNFETVAVGDFLKEAGKDMPGLHRYVSVYKNDFIENKNAFTLDPKHDDMVVTFGHILDATDIPRKLKRMLDALSEKIDTPVDIEFAHDGEHIYLLQCRPQGSGLQSGPAPIPKNLNAKDIVFTADKFISDGLIEGITHVVYVDGDAYNALPTLEDLLDVGKAVGLLNDALPRRKYILMGPGRWGSRGDVKLGVRVTYSDISGTAALIEIAKEKHSYVPELSFGTHFFQDLVEADIVYIPLYPDQKGIVFKEEFFADGGNLLPEILPQYARLADVVKVVDIPGSHFGQTLSIHMNSDLGQAVAFLRSAQAPTQKSQRRRKEAFLTAWEVEDKREQWRWRNYMAQQIADSLDMKALGVKGVYLFGSTNTENSGLGSDIDLLFHVEDAGGERRALLESWLDGWSRALAKINYLHTGYNSEKLLDAHIVTDEDIRKGDSYAIKINSLTDPATPLRLDSGE